MMIPVPLWVAGLVIVVGIAVNIIDAPRRRRAKAAKRAAEERLRQAQANSNAPTVLPYGQKAPDDNPNAGQG